MKCLSMKQVYSLVQTLWTIWDYNAARLAKTQSLFNPMPTLLYFSQSAYTMRQNILRFIYKENEGGSTTIENHMTRVATFLLCTLTLLHSSRNWSIRHSNKWQVLQKCHNYIPSHSSATQRAYLLWSPWPWGFHGVCTG